MQVYSKIKNWLVYKFEIFLTKVGEENQPIPHDYDHLVDESILFTESDKICDEKGGF